MSTRLRLPIAARGRKRPFLALLAVFLFGFATSCGGNDNPNSNQITPITAGITINSPGSGPVVYLNAVGASNDVVTIDVMLRMTTQLEFHGFTLHFKYDPTIIQFAGQMQIPDSDGRTFNPFGECGTPSTYCGKYPAGSCNTMTSLCTAPTAKVGTMCTQDADCDLPATSGPLLCPVPGNEIVSGELFLELFGDISGQCDSYFLPGGPTDVFLMRLAFNVTTETAGTPLDLISQTQTSMSGDCAILDANLDSLGIPCDNGMATITGSR